MRGTIASIIVATGLAGCCTAPDYMMPPECPPGMVAQPTTIVTPPAAPCANPAFVPVVDHEVMWEQTVDVVDDYFRIDHEEPVRALGNEAIEGVLTTVPEVSPTILEPWRRDAGDYQERVEDTLQTMRRHAVVRVIPQPTGGHLVDVQVYKELENLPKPQDARAGTATLSYDTSFTRIENPIGDQPVSDLWISRGRDVALEQRILGDLLCRTGQAAPIGSVAPLR